MVKRKSLAAALQRTQDDVKRIKQATAKEEAARRFKNPQLQRQYTLAQQKKAKGADAPDDKATAQLVKRALIPFRRQDRVLLLGEGNFSFAGSVAQHHLDDANSLLATSFDTLEEVEAKYTEAHEHIQLVTDCGGTVLHGIDATRLAEQKSLICKDFSRQHSITQINFDAVVFNFPHVAAGIKDQDRNIIANQTMLRDFFHCVQAILTHEGCVAVSLALGKTYERWNIKGLAKDAGLQLARSGQFVGAAFPGYEHRRTSGDPKAGRSGAFSGGAGETRESRWYVFTVRRKEEEDAESKKNER